MDKPKAEIHKRVDGYTELKVYAPAIRSTETFLFDKGDDMKTVKRVVQGIIDALHEALDEVAGDGE